MVLLSAIRTSFRNVLKNKMHTVVNIAGLSLGIFCAIVILLILQYELSFDTFHRDLDRIYQVVARVQRGGAERAESGVPYPLPPALRAESPQVEFLSIVDANFANEPVISVERVDGSRVKFQDENILAYVQPEFFGMFTYTWLQGDREKALSTPNSAVLTIGIAEKYFGTTDVVGKTFSINAKTDVQVTGLVDDPPGNSEIPMKIFVTFDPRVRAWSDWGSSASPVHCYIKLVEGATPERVNQSLQEIFSRNYQQSEGQKKLYYLLPFQEMHFHPEMASYVKTTISRQTLWVIGLIGMFVLLAACINFVNLNTALALQRSKEVGVRKVLGSSRAQLVMHFLLETMIVTLVGFLVSMVLIESALPMIDAIVGYQLHMNLLDGLALPGLLLGIFVFTTLVAGLYPAFYLSGFSPLQAIRNTHSAHYGEKITLRRALVILQFIITQALIIGILVMKSQMDYIRSIDMGFNHEAIVETEIPSNSADARARLKTGLLQSTAIKHVAFSNSGAASRSVWGGNYQFLGDTAAVKEDQAQIKFVNEDFLHTFGLKLLAGREMTAVDTSRYYWVNKSFARAVGFEERLDGLLGANLNMWGETLPIAGVVNDFNTNSLQRPLEPVILMVSANNLLVSSIKIDMVEMEEALRLIKKEWSEAYPNAVYSYTFLDETIDKFYQKETRTADLVGGCALLAIFIGCIGLFGLVSYISERRTKEIGIRKVLGATFQNIITMFVREIGVLLVLAFMLATPLTYMVLGEWLDNFAYRIDMGWVVFFIALTISMVIAGFTVAYKVFRTSGANPVDALRYE